MPRGRKLASLTLTDEQQDELEGIAARGRSLFAELACSGSLAMSD